MSRLPLNNYLNRQSEVTETMRTVLLDWLVDLHLKLKMFPRTLFIMISILDNYLAQKQIKKQELQLVGAAVLFLSAKYE